MKRLLSLLIIPALLIGLASPGEKHWENARILSHNLQRMVPPGDTKARLLDVLVLDFGDQAYTLARVSGWSGNNTKMADLNSDSVQAYRPWGPAPLASAGARQSLSLPITANLHGGAWFQIPFSTPYIIKVIDKRNKEVAYEVIAIADTERTGARQRAPGVNPTEGRTERVGGSDVASAALLQSAERGFIGAYSDDNPNIRYDGVQLSRVIPGGPADRAGLKPGDVINAVNEHYIYTGNELMTLIRGLQPGAAAHVRFRRGSQMNETTITVGDLPDNAGR